MPQGPTQYLIHEEGGLERWFNLTITNVGLEAVADYTCVAVNAGGVMEEAITLTFEEPEPVSTFLVIHMYERVCNSKVGQPHFEIPCPLPLLQWWQLLFGQSTLYVVN